MPSISIRSLEIIIKGSKVGSSTLNHNISPERAEETALAGETRRKIKMEIIITVKTYF